MDIEQIEKLLSGIIKHLEEQEEVSAAALLPVMQCQLLLHICYRLDAIESELVTVNRDYYK